MAEERFETRVGEVEFLWTRCCCGVKCSAKPTAGTFFEVGEYTFVESIEKTALRCQEAALEVARKKLG